MSDTYYLYYADGAFAGAVEPGTTVTLNDLKLDGFQKPIYGERRNNNLIKLLTHFASEEDPSNPGNPPPEVIAAPRPGQLWFNRTPNPPSYPNGQLLLFDGSVNQWVEIGTDIYSIDAVGTSGTVTINKIAASEPPTEITNIAPRDLFEAHVVETTDVHTSGQIEVNPAINGQEDVQNAIAALAIPTQLHIDMLTGAHASEHISIAGIPGLIATDTRAAIDELQSDINTLSSTVGGSGASLIAHINSGTDAHDAEAISFDNAVTGFSATNVEAALVELNNNANVSSASNVLDSLRVFRSTNQTLNSTAGNKVLFNQQTVGIGTLGAQYNTITGRYTAAYDQIIRVRVTLRFQGIQNENYSFGEIRRNGSVQRRAQMYEWSENTPLAGTVAFSCLVELSAGQYIEVFAGRNNPGSHNLIGGSSSTYMEIDILRDLS
jgi:hypothetical protein